jgi:uncharacterized protein Smg (DUF494 family)
MPEEIKNLLRKAGFKKKDLKNKEKALMIFKNLIMGEVNFSSIEKPQTTQQNPDESKIFENEYTRSRGNSSSGSFHLKFDPSNIG